jgi:hypothetical protein
MPRRPPTVWLLIASSLFLGFGCQSRSGPSSQVVVGPHHGVTIRLADDQGFAEIVNEPEVGDRGSRQPTAIVVYFLQTDGKTPLTPPPSDVRVEVDLGRRRSEKLPMKAEPKSADPAGTSRFVSKPGPFLLQDTRGLLFATLGGRQIELSFDGGH